MEPNIKSVAGRKNSLYCDTEIHRQVRRQIRVWLAATGDSDGGVHCWSAHIRITCSGVDVLRLVSGRKAGGWRILISAYALAGLCRRGGDRVRVRRNLGGKQYYIFRATHGTQII